MKIKLFIFVVLIELIIITLLAFQVNINKKNILGTISVNPVEKKTIILVPNNNLKYFYEPKSNITEYTPDWFPFKAAYTINEDALNERYNYSINKSDDVFRIITLGDSFTFGIGVNTIENWPERLEDLLNEALNCRNKKFEVINLGVGGYDFVYSVERYKKRGIKYNPDLIIWLLIDFNRIDEKVIPLNNAFFEELKKNKVGLDQLAKKGEYYLTFKKAVDQIKTEFGEEKIFEYQKSNISMIDEYYQKNLVFFLPPWFLTKEVNFLSSFSKSRPQTFLFQENFKTFSENNRLPDGHPNQKGHQIIALDLFNYLTKNKIVPCN